MEVIHLTATELQQYIRTKKLSPVEVMQAYLDRIEQEDKRWNAYVTMNERALEEAKLAEEALVRGEDVGVLHGIPIAIKDLTPTIGMLTTYGSPLFKDFIPKSEPTFMRRIRAAGAIVLGKTNTPEFGHTATTSNPLFGTTKNPWDEKLTPGGSSGGSAAAVAAKMAPFAEGSDGGGSIRIPASLTGTFGFKPTYGVVPYDGDPNNAFNSQHPYLHNGPMTRTVEDAILLFHVMKGYAPKDPDSVPIATNDQTRDGRKVKIAYSRDLGLFEVSTDVTAVIEKACEHFRELGYDVEAVELDLQLSKAELFRTFLGYWSVKFAAGYGASYAEQPELFSEVLGQMIEYGSNVLAVDFKRLDLMRTKAWHALQQIFKEYDFLISPTLATTAFDHRTPGPTAINGKKINQMNDWMLTQLYNLTGHPAASLPVGLTEAGLPVGLQIAGRKFSDDHLLQLCAHYEAAFETYIDPLAR